MCRSIKVLYNLDSPVTDEDIRAAARQFVRKVTGFQKPSQANEQSFEHAIDDITEIAMQLFDTLVTKAKPRQPKNTHKQLSV